MIREFCSWLSETPLSQALQNASWSIPTAQTVHILSVAVVMTSMAMLDLRLLRRGAAGPSVSMTAQRLVPPTWYALAVLAVSGVVLICAEPERELLSPAFTIKMALLLLAATLTYVIARGVKARETYWDERPIAATSVAVVSLLLWVGIVSAGRWIAYVPQY